MTARNRAEQLRAQGLSLRQIATACGVSATTVLRWLDPDYAERGRRLSRKLKDRYRGTCEDCGATTTGCNGPGSAPRWCCRCAPSHTMKKLRGRGHQQQRTLAFLADGPKRFTEIADHLGVAATYVPQHLTRLMSYGLIVRLERGVYALPAEREAA